MATGIWSFSAKATNSAFAPEVLTPPPATMMGRSAPLHDFQRPFDARRLRLGPVGGDFFEILLDDEFQVGHVLFHLPQVPAEAQVHRAGRPRGGDAEGLAQHVREALDRIHRRVELGDRVERADVLGFLVGVPVADLGRGAAREGDDGRAGEVGVPKPRRQVHAAHDLRHADAGAARGARVAVRHVGRGLLPVGEDAGDARAALIHLGEGVAQIVGTKKMWVTP